MTDKIKLLNFLLKEREDLWNKSDDIGQELSKIESKIEKTRSELILESGILGRTNWFLQNASHKSIHIKAVSNNKLSKLLTNFWYPEDYHSEICLITDDNNPSVVLRFDDGEFSISSYGPIDDILQLIKDQKFNVDLSKLSQIKENYENNIKIINDILSKFC